MFLHSLLLDSRAFGPPLCGGHTLKRPPKPTSYQPYVVIPAVRLYQPEGIQPYTYQIGQLAASMKGWHKQTF